MQGGRRDQRGNKNPAYKHGMSNSPEFTAWRNIKVRCYNKNDPRYLNYGDKGVSVCERWLEDFLNFYEDMGDRPEGCSIERKNNKGNYTPDNCIWATQHIQNRNRSNNVWLTLGDRRMIMADWAVETSITVNAIVGRIKRGWSDEKILTTPMKDMRGQK